MLPQPVSCLCNVNCVMSSYSVLYSTLTISKTDSSTTFTDVRTHCRCKTPVRFQELSKYQQQEYKMTSESIKAHNFCFSKIRSLSAAENESLSYGMQPVDLTLSMTDPDWGGNCLRGSRRVVLRRHSSHVLSSRFVGIRHERLISFTGRLLHYIIYKTAHQYRCRSLSHLLAGTTSSSNRWQKQCSHEIWLKSLWTWKSDLKWSCHTWVFLPVTPRGVFLLPQEGSGGCAASSKTQQKSSARKLRIFIQLRHAMKLADAEIGAERSSVTREFPVSFLCTKPLAFPRTSLQQ
jgi:hypothetical protein